MKLFGADGTHSSHAFSMMEELALLFLAAVEPTLASAVRFCVVGTPFRPGHGIADAVLIFGIPGMLSVWFLKRYPERVRLTPYSFGYFLLLAVSILGAEFATGAVAGGAATALSCVLCWRLRPSDALGDFSPISFLRALDIGFVVWCGVFSGYGILEFCIRGDGLRGLVALVGGLIAGYGLYRLIRGAARRRAERA